MKYPTVFHLISSAFNKKNVSGILIGGFAVSYYKYSRQSADADFLIKERDFQEILPILKESGYKLDYNNEVFARLISDEGLLMMDIDFMFVDEATFDKMFQAGQRTDIAGCEFIVPSLEHLIALKLHSMKQNSDLRWNKDIGDIVSLVEIGQLDINGKSFKDLCLKYATEEIYRKVLAII